MVEGLYQWIENIAFYMVFMTAALHLIPGDGYRKYLKFFTGMILILLVVSPVLKLAGLEQTFHEIFEKRTYEEVLREIEEETSYLKEIHPEDYLSDRIQKEDGGEKMERGENDE